MLKQLDSQTASLGVVVAQRQFWPTLSVSNDIGPVDFLGSNNATTARLSYSVFNGGQFNADLSSAQVRLELANLDVQTNRLEVALQVMDLYRTWWSHSARAQVFLNLAQKMDDLVQMATRRQQAGVASSLDLNQATSQWRRAEDDYRQAVSQVADARKDLVLFIGQDVLPAFHSFSDWPNLQAPSADALAAQVVDRHPSTLVALWRVELAKAEWEKAKANALPNVVLKLEYQLGSYSGSLAAGSRAYVSTQMSLGPGFSALAARDQAAAKVQSAQMEIQASKLDLTAKVQKIWREASHASEQSSSNDAQIKAQDDVVQANMRLFVAGKRGWPELLAAQREYQQLLVQKVELEATYLGLVWRMQLLSNTFAQFSTFIP
jgi:outer membrane protein TolC